MLCKTCKIDPLNHPYSISSGHDYGRINTLPKLNLTTQNAIVASRAFHIDILVRSNHSTAHAICFPSDGPSEVAKVLPNVSDSRRVQVTFLGPRDAWRKTQLRFRAIYELDVCGAFAWLNVWKGLRHPSYVDVFIDHTKQQRDN